MRRVVMQSMDEDNILVRGQNLYQVNCSSCHGSPGSREPSHFPSLADVDERFSTSQITGIIENGISQMPGFPHLSDDEKEAIVEYLFNLDEEGNVPESLAGGSVVSGESDEFSEQRESSESVVSGESVESAKSGDKNTEYTFAVDFAFRPFVDHEGFPATKPPWGTMNAIDMNTGDMVWRVPLGGYPLLSPFRMKRTNNSSF